MPLRSIVFTLILTAGLAGARGAWARGGPFSRPQPVTDKSPVTAKNIVGTWLTGDHTKDETYFLKPDGSLRIDIDEEDDAAFMDGTWAFSNGVLSMTGTGESETLRFQVWRVAKDLIDLSLVSDEPTAVHRWILKDDKRPPEPTLVGTWSAEGAEPAWVLILKEGGDFESRSGKSVVGTWKRSAAALHLLVDGKTDTVIDMNLRWRGPDQLEVVGIGRGDRTKTLRRGGASTPLPAPSPLVGVWIARDATTEVRLTIEASGRFEQIIVTSGTRSVTRGTWRIEGHEMVVRPEGQENDLRIPFRLVEGGQLVLDAGGDPTTLVRQGTGGTPIGTDASGQSGRVQQLYGTWLMRTDAVEMHITLRRDGTYAETTRTESGTEANTGRFEIKGSTLIAHVDKTGETMKLNWRLVDANTLEIVDDEGNGARLMRQP